MQHNSTHIVGFTSEYNKPLPGKPSPTFKLDYLHNTKPTQSDWVDLPNMQMPMARLLKIFKHIGNYSIAALLINHYAVLLVGNFCKNPDFTEFFVAQLAAFWSS